MPFSAGHKLGPYEILAPIGAGGMGEVYKARDSRLAIARMASKCRTTARGTKNPGIRRNGKLLNSRLGTSAWISLNGPGDVSTARITTFVKARRPSTLQARASLIPNRPLVDTHAMRPADAPI